MVDKAKTGAILHGWLVTFHGFLVVDEAEATLAMSDYFIRSILIHDFSLLLLTSSIIVYLHRHTRLVSATTSLGRARVCLLVLDGRHAALSDELLGWRWRVVFHKVLVLLVLLSLVDVRSVAKLGQVLLEQLLLVSMITYLSVWVINIVMMLIDDCVVLRRQRGGVKAGVDGA